MSAVPEDERERNDKINAVSMNFSRPRARPQRTMKMSVFPKRLVKGHRKFEIMAVKGQPKADLPVPIE